VCAEESGDLDKRQAENAVMASFDPAEQMHAGAFDLIASRAPQRRLADHIEIGVDLGFSHSPDMKAVRGKVMPDSCAVPKHDNGG